MKQLITCLFILFLVGCAQGGTVMLTGEKPQLIKPISEIELLIEKPTKSYKVLALINSSAKTQSQFFGSSSEAETAALEQLKVQAAQAGADAVMDIKQEVLENGAVISSVAWGQASASGSAAGNNNYASGQASGTGSAFGFGNWTKNREMVFRAKAIKWK